MTTSLTLTHLRFEARALTPIKLGEHQAGERLRDALAQVMLRAVCPETPYARSPTPEHAAVCPVCWLLAYEGKSGQGEKDTAGEVRRAYSLVPPISPPDTLETGQPFSFTFTLFGQGFQYLPFFVLAVPEIGRTGIGPGRGRFELQAIYARNPLAGGGAAHDGENGAASPTLLEPVLSPGEKVVRVPKNRVTWEAIQIAADRCAVQLNRTKSLRIHFLTPTRLVEDEILVKSPDFGVFFRRLLQRIDQLGQQYAGESRRPEAEVERLHTLADQVRMVQADIQWVDLWGPSRRRGRPTPMGGFTGSAVYHTRDWTPFIPWLLFGQGVQVGKLTAKGNGVFQVDAPGLLGYWTGDFRL